MSDINLKIDGKNVTVPKGTNIFMAAKNNGNLYSGVVLSSKINSVWRVQTLYG